MGVGFCSPSMHLVVPLGDCCILPKYFGALFLVLSFIKCSLVLPIKEKKKKKKTLFAFCYGVINCLFLDKFVIQIFFLQRSLFVNWHIAKNLSVTFFLKPIFKPCNFFSSTKLVLNNSPKPSVFNIFLNLNGILPFFSPLQSIKIGE